MGVVKIKNNGQLEKPLLGVISKQVEAAVAEAAVDISGMMSYFVKLDDQLVYLTKAGLIDASSAEKMEHALNEIVVHMQCFDLLSQKLTHVQSALELIENEIPTELNNELSVKLSAKIADLYSSSQELNVHLGFDDDTSCSTSELF
ncbi:hypothetical protein [Zhongshania sp. BJYM1]|uniref:hypothetical protein n=1 Tax=Zhongshania aquatica TaxID=2965069 RepID=UPI0022B3837C|nr:hypothetical protein [Marortus sp. BJYM1]